MVPGRLFLASLALVDPSGKGVLYFGRFGERRILVSPLLFFLLYQEIKTFVRSIR